MKITVLFFLLLLACMYLSLAQGSYENCCLKYSSEVEPKMKRRIMSYRIQETDGSCNIAAVIFRMKNRRKTFCADPNKQWVKDLTRIKIQEDRLN